MAQSLSAEIRFRGIWRLKPVVVIGTEWNRLYLDEANQQGGIFRINFKNSSQAILFWRDQQYRSSYAILSATKDYSQIHFKIKNNLIHFYLTVTLVDKEYLYIYSIDQQNGLSESWAKKPFFCEFIGVMDREKG